MVLNNISKNFKIINLFIFFNKDYDNNQENIGNPKKRKYDSINEKLVNMIVECNLPISIVEKKSFKVFVYSFDADYRAPSRSTINNNILPKKVIKPPNAK